MRMGCEVSQLLHGCRAKLERAHELLASLEIAVERYLTQDPPLFKLDGRHSEDGLEYALMAYGVHEVPLWFSVVTGEIVHHMRSSLDHMVCALVARNGGTPTRLHQFPICTTKDAFKKACERGYLKGVGPTAKQLIKDVQPFTSTTPDDTVLWVVSEYDNADKHRLLTVLTSIATVGDITIGTDESIEIAEGRKSGMPTIVGFGDMGMKRLSKDGVPLFSIQLAEPAPELTASAPLAPQVALDRCGRVELAPLVPTLRNLLLGTQHTIDTLSRELS